MARVKPVPSNTGVVELVWPAVALGLISEIVGAAAAEETAVSITTRIRSEAGPATPEIEV